MNAPMLEIKQLRMNYGDTQALRDLSLTVQPGDIYGLIGPNGAGKTTTFKILATILQPAAGTAVISGLSLANSSYLREIRSKIGYMPDTFGLYEDMTAEEYLSFFAAAYDIPVSRRAQLVEDVLALVDLRTRRNTLVDTLSRGTQQRLGIARVLIHDPDLLILDEPASGLDPRARVEIRSLLMELQRMGKTIVISSHILSDIGEICNRVGIIESGRLLVDGTIADIMKMVKPSTVVNVRVAERLEDSCNFIRQLPYVTEAHIESETIVLQVMDGFDDLWQLSRAMIQNGFKLNYLEPESKNLEHAFMEITQGYIP